MTTPSERFKARQHVVHINLRIREDLMERIAAYGNQKRLNLTDSIRVLLDHALTAEGYLPEDP